MDFWNIAIPALTFLAPTVACLYFTLRTRSSSQTESNWGMATFGLVMLISIFALIRFESPVKLEALWPFSAEPSGYFEFSLQLHWTRYIWIFFTNAILFSFCAFDGRKVFQNNGRSLKFIFLAGVSLLSSLAYLSENVLLSLMFIEIVYFLLHAFSLQTAAGEGDLERVSYFKRNSFLFLALVALFASAAGGVFTMNAVVLLGLVLYIMSFIFSKHNFADWSQLQLSLIQGGALFFLLGQIVREDLSPPLWVPVSAVFAVFSAAFAGLCLMALTALSSSFWLLFSMVGYLIFLRFISGRPEDPFWGLYEALALGAIFSISTLFRFGPRADQAWKKVSAYAITALLLAIASGAIPGIDIAGARATLETPIKLMALGALTFLLSMVASKSLVVAFHKESGEKEDGQKYVSALLPSLCLLLLQVGAVVRVTDLYGEGPFRMGAAYLLTNPHIATMGIAVLSGLFAGLVLGSNLSFVKWIGIREKRMEDLFPSIDPVVKSWNERAFLMPERGMDWISNHITGASNRAAAFIQSSDKSLFGESFYRGFREYSNSLSHLARFFHSGSIRAYMFLGILMTFFASVWFLMEGQ